MVAHPCVYAPYSSLICALRACTPVRLCALTAFALSSYKYRCVTRPPCTKIYYSKKQSRTHAKMPILCFSPETPYFGKFGSKNQNC